VRTPYRIPASEFSDSLKHFLDACCVLHGNTLCCTTCGTPILHVRTALSIHSWAHGGCKEQKQRVWNIAIPYCPRCEDKPQERGCLYLSMMAFPKAS